MNVLMDDEIFSSQDSYGGISRLYSNYINFFKEDKDINIILPFYFSNNNHLSQINKKISFFKNINFYKKISILRKINSIKLNTEIKKNKHDILHLTYMDTNLISLNKKKLTCVIHDLIPEKFPKYFRNTDVYSKKKKELIQKSNRIITVSNTTKNDLVKYYNASDYKIEVIYPPIDTFSKPIIEKISLPERFIIYVGNRHGYKNFNYVLRLLR